MTSAEPSPAGASAYDAALCAALTTEYAVIYGYGIVSAHCAPAVNDLVSSALSQHRERRDQVIQMLATSSVDVPVAAAGYQLPIAVRTPVDAARLAAQMENDTSVAWRAVLEQAQTPHDRGFAVTALIQSAVLTARWNRVVGTWPVSTAFPGAD